MNKIDKIYKLLDDKLVIRHKHEKTNPDFMNKELDRINEQINKLNGK
jgi:hypothetical protein